MKELDFAKQIAINAGSHLLKNFNKLSLKDISFKDRYELVTRLDFESEKIILEAIKKAYPKHEILSEEAGFVKGTDHDYKWIIDPLDGTTNYRIGSPLFAVLISLSYKKEIQFGLAYAPALGEFYEAEIGKKTRLNNRPIRVSRTKNIKESINLYCHGSTKKDISRAIKIYNKLKVTGRDCRQLGCAAIEFGFVAAGRAESIMIPGAHAWDVAAGALMVRQAGGRVTDFEGKDWHLGSKDILATNGFVHDKLLKIVNNI